MMDLIKKNSIIVIIAALVALSWSGISAKYSQKYIDNSIKNTAIVYASARGINAIVSVFQSSELSVQFFGGAAIKVGEILDPINDSIERFSQIVSMALGSLVLQKILANIVAQKLFNWMITIFAIGLIISLYFSRHKYINFTGKGFLLLTFAKFLFVITIVLNAGVSTYFLNNDIDKNHQKLDEFQDGLSSQIGGLTVGQKNELNQENKSLNQTIDEKQETIKNIRLYNDSIKLNKKEREYKKNKLLTKYNRNCKWWWFDSKKCDGIDAKIAQVKVQIANNIKNIKNNEKIIDKSEKYIKQARKKIKINKDKINNKSSMWTKVRDFSIDISDETIEKYIVNLFNLIVLFILKTILLPLGFFYLLIKGLKRIWHLNWLNYLKD